MGIKKEKRTVLVFILLITLSWPCFPQQKDTLSRPADTNVIHKGRLTGLLVAQGTLYFASLTGLYFAWYKDYPQTSFHFFNDSNEWLWMDKMGHMTTAYYISRIGYESYKWSGVKPNHAAWYGGLLAFSYLLNIEILDGFSSEWGFSATDLAANTLGCALFIGQQLGWKEQRFML